jgi:hypothetical protein
LIKHIVMWKLKDYAEGLNNYENARYIKKVIEGLKDKIPEIHYIEVGVNINDSKTAYDAVLYSEFDKASDLEAYRTHPEQMKISSYIRKVRENRIVVDYIV